MENNDNIYILVNAAIGNLSDLEVLRRVYPELIFERITPGIYTVQVPQGQEAVFDRFKSRIDFITETALYGLNAVQPAFEVSNIAYFHQYPYGELRGTGVMIGFVDTGIDYTNPLFQNADGTTRISVIWDQTIPGAPPQQFNYGSVYQSADINRALQSGTPYEVVPSRDETGHGTFLAGIAAGNDQADENGYTGGAPDAGIMMVKLRQASRLMKEAYLVSEATPAYQSNDIMAGISFLLDAAYNAGRPLIICIGLGNNFGAHNGTDVMEKYLADITGIANVICVVAAGNEGSSGHHYKGTISSGISEDVEINVDQNEKGFLMFFWAGLINRIELQVKSPLGEVISRIPFKSDVAQEFTFKLEQTRLTVRYIYPEPFTGGEAVIVRLEAPTPGIWTVNVYAQQGVTGDFHVWMSRKGFVSETTRFLKSDPDTTVQIPGTEAFSIVVGAYNYVDDSIYASSGRGPTTSGLIKPDFVAPGVNVTGPSPGGGFTTYAGTSTAAAVTSAACALLMQWAIIEGKFENMNTRIARGILTRGARRQRDVVYPNNIEGYGRLDLQNSISSL